MGKSKGGMAPDSTCEEEEHILKDMERLIKEFHDPARSVPPGNKTAAYCIYLLHPASQQKDLSDMQQVNLHIGAPLIYRSRIKLEVLN